MYYVTWNYFVLKQCFNRKSWQHKRFPPRFNLEYVYTGKRNNVMLCTFSDTFFDGKLEILEKFKGNWNFFSNKCTHLH